VSYADSTGLEAVGELVRDLRGEGITLVVARLHSPIDEEFEQAGLVEAIGKERFYPTVRAAVAGCSSGGGRSSPAEPG